MALGDWFGCMTRLHILFAEGEHEVRCALCGAGGFLVMVEI